VVPATAFFVLVLAEALAAYVAGPLSGLSPRELAIRRTQSGSGTSSPDDRWASFGGDGQRFVDAEEPSTAAMNRDGPRRAEAMPPG
jgi:hypothetical protein